MDTNDPSLKSAENLPPLPPAMPAQLKPFGDPLIDLNTSKKKRPGCLKMGLGFITILGALVLLVIMVLAISVAASSAAQKHELTTILFFSSLDLIGLVGGILSFTSIKKLGPIFCVIFWVLILSIVGFVYLAVTSIQF